MSHGPPVPGPQRHHLSPTQHTSMCAHTRTHTHTLLGPSMPVLTTKQPHSQQDKPADPAKKVFCLFCRPAFQLQDQQCRRSPPASLQAGCLQPAAKPHPDTPSKLGPGNAVTQFTCFRVEEPNVTGRVWLIKVALTDRLACFCFLREMHGPCV